MRGLQRSKRVYWAPDANLCQLNAQHFNSYFQQVRLFLSEESPSQVGFGAQDHLQAKALHHPSGTAGDDFLPPGFEGGHPPKHSQIKLPEIPLVKWRCPPRFILNITWRVVAGEESEDVEAQNQRELRVLEAVYPRPSVIPPNPTFAADAQDYGDHQVTLIPITPIEDEDTVETSSDGLEPCNVAMSSHSQLLAFGAFPHCSTPNIPSTSANENQTAGVFHRIEPDVVTAASAAFTAINKNNENGGLIDHDLLIKILSNPKMIEKLVSDHGSASNAPNTDKPYVSNVLSSDYPPPTAALDPSHVHMNQIESSKPSLLAVNPSAPYYAQAPPGMPQGIQTSAVPSVPAPPAKDVNYYKKLIEQHGGDRPEAPQPFVGRYNNPQIGKNQELPNPNPKPRDSKPKIMKPCIFFNSSRGCRNGANCAYQHDASSQQRVSNVSDVPSGKRMKMDREISS
ncbi:hypothetical protein K2173_027809 [Erythroxylum novogranatense]|uniref:C3H1-type domain-containing protein n=1 Tax=Erythroxylum novogranatense TaxID=1862640 RepID=A0AAV8U032_9ROSI|nr:hypothetical protein K2173_027809 [Erythroxylum novogranatense]